MSGFFSAAVARLKAALSEITGAASIGADDGVSGAQFSTVAGFIARIKSSLGAATIGFIQPFANAVFRWLSEKLFETVSIKDFGAIGDGVADDATAIQKAFDWVSSGPFRKLEFSANSNYKSSLTLSLVTGWVNRMCQINGNNAQIIYTGVGVCLDVSGNALSTVKDLRAKPSVAGNGTGLYAKPDGTMYAGQARYSNIKLDQFAVGLYWGSQTAGANGGWTTLFDRIDTEGCAIGVQLADGGNNGLTFLHPRVAQCQTGWDISGACYKVKILGGVTEANTVAAYKFSGTGEKFGVDIDGQYLENECSDFVFADGTTNLRNLKIHNNYIFSSSASKAPVFSTGAGVSASNMAVRDNFVYLSASSNYGNLPAGAVVDNNFTPFESAVAGDDAVFVRGREYGLPAQAAGVMTSAVLTKTVASGNDFEWRMIHQNNDGNYIAAGRIIVTQSGIPLVITQVQQKANNSGAAAGTITVDVSGGYVRFNYTPPAGVTTLAGSSVTIIG